MPLPTKIQPIDAKTTARGDPAKPAAKSRLKRLFERRQFPSVLRTSSAERLAAAGDGKEYRNGGGDSESSSVCLDKLVRNFMEESNEKPPRCGRRRCHCFHGSCNDSSDDDRELPTDDVQIVYGDAPEVLKGLVLCASVEERNLLADASEIVEKSKMTSTAKGDCRRIVADGLRTLGYNAAVCKSRWEKSSSIPPGDYEYVDVIVEGGERLLVDVDFRSEFEIARSTKGYRAVLRSLPMIFVGKEDRLRQIVAVTSEAARQSLRKKGLHFPPWRKPEYMRAKWLAPYERAKATPVDKDERGGEFGDPGASTSEISAGAKEKVRVMVSPWQPPAVKPKDARRRGKVVTGLASIVPEKP